MREFTVKGTRKERIKFIIDEDDIYKILEDTPDFDMYTLIKAIRNSFLTSIDMQLDANLDKGNWFYWSESYGSHYSSDKRIIRSATPNEIIAWKCLDDFWASRTAIKLADEKDNGE